MNRGVDTNLHKPMALSLDFSENSVSVKPIETQKIEVT